MLTLIFDIDGTLTDMWPIEKAVLAALLPASQLECLDYLRKSGETSLYVLYRKITQCQISKISFQRLYSEKFEVLREAGILPEPIAYRAVVFILQNQLDYRYLYATGGLRCEAEYVLEKLCLKELFDLTSSISRDYYQFSKKTGLPYKKIARLKGQYLVVTDSTVDVVGAKKAKLPYVLLKPNSALTATDIQEAQCNLQAE